MVLSSVHSVQEDTKALRGCYDVGDTEPPFECGKNAPPARILGEGESYSDGESNGDICDGEDTERQSPLFVTIAD